MFSPVSVCGGLVSSKDPRRYIASSGSALARQKIRTYNLSDSVPQHRACWNSLYLFVPVLQFQAHLENPSRVRGSIGIEGLNDLRAESSHRRHLPIGRHCQTGLPQIPRALSKASIQAPQTQTPSTPHSSSCPSQTNPLIHLGLQLSTVKALVSLIDSSRFCSHSACLVERVQSATCGTPRLTRASTRASLHIQNPQTNLQIPSTIFTITLLLLQHRSPMLAQKLEQDYIQNASHKSSH